MGSQGALCWSCRLISSDKDIIVLRGFENKVAVEMIVKDIKEKLRVKSQRHQADLARLDNQARHEPLSPNVHVLEQTPQVRGIETVLRDPATDDVDFIFYFDRLATLLIERFGP